MQLIKRWKNGKTPEDRENAWNQVQALETLTNTLIHAIRGEKNG